jgi:hypothetical protein
LQQKLSMKKKVEFYNNNLDTLLRFDIDDSKTKKEKGIYIDFMINYQQIITIKFQYLKVLINMRILKNKNSCSLFQNQLLQNKV